MKHCSWHCWEEDGAGPSIARGGGMGARQPPVDWTACMLDGR